MHKPMDFRRSLPAPLYARAVDLHPYRFPKTAKPGKDEVRIGDRWSLTLDSSCGRLSRLAASDFVQRMLRTFGIRISQRRVPGDKGIVVGIEAGPDGAQSYRREVRRDGVRIIASDDEGGMRGLFHLAGEMLNRRGPLLPMGTQIRRPHWQLRLTSPLIHKPIDDPRDYLAYPEPYLLNMSRYGYNATFIYIDLFDHITPQTEPHLSRPGHRRRLADLNAAVKYWGRFGIRLFAHINIDASLRKQQVV